MVAAPRDLFDRLAGGSESGLRPLLPYFAELAPPAGSEPSAEPTVQARSQVRPPSPDANPAPAPIATGDIRSVSSRVVTPTLALPAAPAQPAMAATAPLTAPGESRAPQARRIPGVAQPFDGDGAANPARAASSRPVASDASPQGLGPPLFAQPPHIHQPAQAATMPSKTAREGSAPAPAPAPTRQAAPAVPAGPLPLPRRTPARQQAVIDIHIGRIEVRSASAAQASPGSASTPRASAPDALAAHLAARRRGTRS